jgi:1,6-anhydro-N-acetylmuramate kinase
VKEFRSTGQVAKLIRSTEPRLAELVRRGFVTPPPPVLAGRRLWEAQHILQAADRLGLLNSELHAALEAELVAARQPGSSGVGQ